MDSRSYVTTDEDIRELIADETPMRRAYELGLADGAHVLQRLEAVLKASKWATKCLDPHTVEDKYPSGAFRAFRQVRCGYCKACLFAAVVGEYKGK